MAPSGHSVKNHVRAQVGDRATLFGGVYSNCNVVVIVVVIALLVCYRCRWLLLFLQLKSCRSVVRLMSRGA